MKVSSQKKRAQVKLSAEKQKELSDLLSIDFEKVIESGVYSFLAQGTSLLIRTLIEAEVANLCGDRYKHDGSRNAQRWGSEPGYAIIRGTKEAIEKPRVRSMKGGKGAEIKLATYEALQNSDELNSKMLQLLLAGVSTRKYATIIEDELRKKGVSKSSVSRRSIEATKPIIDEFKQRQLSDLKLVAIFIDGIRIGKRQVIVSIGVGLNGKKQVIGLRAGATETETVCRDLIRDLKERGLSEKSNYLFVVDGSKALSAAIRAAFGNDTAIQRCLEHKIRDVEAYVPFKQRKTIRARLRAAWNQPTEKQALNRLNQVRSTLQGISETAANSLLEGMMETVTLHRLKITGQLKESLRTTNVIESAFSAARRLTARATRFRTEEAILSWLTRGLVTAEKNFRPVRGYRQLTDLKKRLNEFNPKKSRG